MSRPPRRGRRGAALALALALGACTEAGLEPIPPPEVVRDDKVTLLGELCTRSPESLVFPVRVLFVIDSSESMRVTDPPDPVTGESARERAVRETWERLLAAGAEDVRVGIVRFSSEAQSRTPVDLDGDGLADTYFTASAAQLDAATDALGVTDRTTNYVNALAEAHYELRTELLGASQASLPLTKVVVVFLSDGLPDVDDGEAKQNSTSNILDGVRALRELADLFQVGDFSFHTGFLSAGQGPAADQPAQALLQTMAALGGGTYRSFPSGEELNFLFVDFTVVRRVFALKSLAVVNQNAVVDAAQVDALAALDLDLPPVPAAMGTDLDGDGRLTCGEPLTDSDGDGLADAVELFEGTSWLVADTDDDGLGDRVEWDLARAAGAGSAALDPLDPSDASCFVPAPCLDEDEDAACDCVVDSDGDGVCDCVTDPGSPCADDLGRDCVDADADGWCDCPDRDGDGRCDYADADGDGLHDCEELFLGTAQNGVDTDADGLPDPLEVRFRTSAVARDGGQDLDWDDTLDATEVLGATDPLCADPGLRARAAYRYELTTLGLDGDRTCYRFEVGHVTLVETAPNRRAARPGNGANRLMVYAGEVAFDAPDAFARWRVACVDAAYRAAGGYKDPPSGRIRLTEGDFVDVGAFDPDRDCRSP